MQSAVLISIIANPSPPTPRTRFPTRVPLLLNPALGHDRSPFFRLRSEDVRFPISVFNLSPQKPDRRTKTRRGWIFICVWLLGRRGRAGDLQENPPGRKGSDRGRGSHFYLFGVGRVQRRGVLPHAPRPAGLGGSVCVCGGGFGGWVAQPGPAVAAGPGQGGARSRSPCPAPAHTLSAATCLNKEKLHNQRSSSVRPSVPPSVKVALGGGGGGTSRPRTLSPARPRLFAAPRRTDALSLLHCSLRP